MTSLRLPLFLLILMAGDLFAQAHVSTSAMGVADVGARIAAADRRLGSGCGEIEVDQPGTVATAFTLHPCHSLHVAASLTWTAPGSELEGGQQVTCLPGTRIAYTGPKDSAIFTTPLQPIAPVAEVTAGTGCHIDSAQPAVLLAVPQNGHHVTVRDAVLSNLVAIDACERSPDAAHDCSDINLLDTTVTGGNYGLHVVFTHGARARGNRFDKILNGAVFWGGDAATEPSTGDRALGRTTDIDFSENTCVQVQACTWGSMGRHVIMRGNIAHGCADVCFDVEGSDDVLIADTLADACGNGCGATFFETTRTTMTGNVWSSHGSGTLILIKNVSRDPRLSSGTVIRGNTLACAEAVCAALAYDASEFDFVGNTVENGVLRPTFMNGNTSIRDNHLHFTQPIPAGTAVLELASIEFGRQGSIAGNWVVSDVPQPATAICIHTAWTDFNANDSYEITGNHCEGASPFPTDLSTETAGGNPGPRAFWMIAGNWWAGGTVIHRAGQHNEVYQELDRYTRQGLTWTHTASPPTP